MQSEKRCTIAKVQNSNEDTNCIDNILPNEIIQIILSYERNNLDIKIISKLFKKLSDLNDEIESKYIEQRVKSYIENEYNIFNIHDTHFRDTINYIVDENRSSSELNQKVTNCIASAIAQSNDGDTLLISDGIYSLGDLTINHNTAFIGMVGSNVIITLTKPINISNVVYFQNIQFICPDIFSYGNESAINVENNGHVFMQHCKMMLKAHPCRCQGINMITNSKNNSIYLRQCEFENGTTAVSISPSSNAVNILGCKFKNCGANKGCEGYASTIEIKYDSIENSKTEIKIIGNEITNDATGKWIGIQTFIQDEFYSTFNIPNPDKNTQIVEQDKCDQFIKHRLYDLRDNLITGTNSTFTNDNHSLERRNPNKIYHTKTTPKCTIDYFNSVRASWAWR
eukprot:294295_1